MYVNVARFARNVEWDFFCDFQTPWACSRTPQNCEKYRENFARIAKKTSSICWGFFRFCEYFLPEKILHFKCRLRMQSFIIKDPKCIDQGVPCRQADRHANYFSNIYLFLYDNTFVQPRSTRRILLLSSPPWTAGAPIRQLDEHKYCINGTEKKNNKK